MARVTDQTILLAAIDDQCDLVDLVSHFGWDEAPFLLELERLLDRYNRKYPNEQY